MTEHDDVTMPVGKPKSSAKRLGRYELSDRLGKGGMGVVYRALDPKLGREVAVKLLLTDLEEDNETRERFLREARAAGELNHRNVIEIFDFGEDEGRAFIVMELLEGSSLNDFLKEHPDLALQRKLQIMTEVCEGLAFSHSRKIIHRDLKPGNLFITKGGLVKVLDFGLARVASSKLTRSGLVFGTPDYMSPEQVRGKVVDERSDIFSLGAVFYQMLSGRKPFSAKVLPEVMRKVLTEDPPALTHAEAPPSLARVVLRALQKEPLKRYQSVEELLGDLRGIDLDEAPDVATESDDPRQIDRYQILERVGQGGMGVVYRARDPVLDRDVAIKCMLVDFGVDEDARARFQQEARSAAKLQHPNIVTIYEFGEKDDSPYLIMQFLGGNDLEELMRRDTPLDLQDRLEIVAQLCDGLAFAHERGVVHRDIKPGNVRVLDDGSVKLLDFGIAKVANADATAGVFAGSPAYASPEQLSLESVDGRSDLFSVGVLAYALLTGRQPFTGDSAAAVAYQVLNEEPPSPRSLVPALPEKLEAILTRALQKKPDARWESAQELGEAFREVAGELAAASPVSRPAGQRTIVRGTRRNEVGNLDLQAGLGRPETSDQVGEAPLVGTGPAVEAAPTAKPRNWVAAVAALALVAAMAVGGFYAFRVLGENGGSAPAQVEVTPPVETSVAPAPMLTLEVTSTPEGAVVTRDGEDTGQTTPASFPLEEPYPELIAVSLDGYVSDSREVRPVEGESLTMEFELAAEVTYGRVVLSGPYAFEVFIGRQQIGERAVSHDFTWNTGSTTLRIRSAEVFLDSSYTVNVTEGEPARLFAPALGSLTVFTRPGDCEIFLGSESLGYPPITERPVAPGSYTVRRECEDDPGQNNDQSVTVASGQNEIAPFVPVQQ